jgi:hypothetical protein
MIQIGGKEFKYKKDVILHYRNILNSYDFEQTLNSSDFKDIIDLLHYGKFQDIDNIIAIKVFRIHFNTKCFEILRNDNTISYFSYLMIINNQGLTPEKLFNRACRSSVRMDILSVKQDYFGQNSVNRAAKCQETSIMSKWEEMVVDHRQPNTFSVIVDRFREVNRIDIELLEYLLDENNDIVFKDESLSESFRKYHNEKATLRVVRKERNSSRANQARVKKSSKDLQIRERPNKMSKMPSLF